MLSSLPCLFRGFCESTQEIIYPSYVTIIQNVWKEGSGYDPVQVLLCMVLADSCKLVNLLVIELGHG